MTHREIHAVLQKALDDLLTLYGQVDGLSPDTCLAIGYAMGTLSKAKALVGRDIDDAKARERPS